MIICVAGDNHGAIDRLYADILDFEDALNVRFEVVLHVGDFGVWPDASRIDKATRNHDGAGDFPVWFSENRRTPRRTIFVKGNHEDFVWLDEQTRTEVLPELFYLKNGSRMTVESEGQTITVCGIGGCFGPSDFGRDPGSLQGYAKRHYNYTRKEIDMLIKDGRLDVLLVHDAPAGVTFETHRRGRGWVSDVEGLDDAVRGTRPRVCFFGHHHTRLDSSIEGVPCLGLAKVPYPGSLIALDLPLTAGELRSSASGLPAGNSVCSHAVKRMNGVLIAFFSFGYRCFRFLRFRFFRFFDDRSGDDEGASVVFVCAEVVVVADFSGSGSGGGGTVLAGSWEGSSTTSASELS